MQNEAPTVLGPSRAGMPLANSYSRLPERFFSRLAPTPVAAPRLIAFNGALAAELGLDLAQYDPAALAALFSGNSLPPGAVPIAMAYAGHQFGHFVPQLGDGRAILLGEVRGRDGTRRDIQLKGSGRTPYSRSGDGRAALGPVLREYLVSEAMHALGIPTTRALAAVLTGDQVLREQTLPGAVLTRIAQSHIRIGTFEYFAARGDKEAVRVLADYAIDRHYADLRAAPRPYLALLGAVAERQAQLIARWMQVGFIHGVMNTDNMAVSGETIDFGPCAFMDHYDPATVFSSIDDHGRYAYANQPHAAAWNLARFAETLLPLIDPSTARAVEFANESLAQFHASYRQHWLAGMRRKLGIVTAEEGDEALVGDWLEALRRGQADFTLSFRRLADAAEHENGDAGVRALFADPGDYALWSRRWRTRLAREPVAPAERAIAMRLISPAVIPRNHRVERALRAAVEEGDFTEFHSLLAALSRPYASVELDAPYAQPPHEHERVLRTFCGT